jgi:hypothetical protein
MIGRRPHRTDPELPILDEIETMLVRELDARRHADAAHGRAARAPHRGSRRRPPAHRVARRAGMMLAALFLVGATAIGAESLIQRREAPTPLVVAAGGATDPWRLSAYRRGPAVCYVFLVARNVTNACEASPPPHVATATGVRSRFVFGLTEQAARIVVRQGATVRSTTARPITAAADRLPAGLRWFVVVLRRPLGGDEPPVHVTVLPGHGQPFRTTLPAGRPASAEPARHGPGAACVNSSP